jgi:hypothetical protein
MEITVVPAEPHANPEQAGKMLLREHGGFLPVGENAAFTQ